MFSQNCTRNMNTKWKHFCAIFTLFNAFLSLSCFDFHIGNQRRRQANLERFDNTCGGRNVPIIFKYTSMRNEGTKLLMNSTITVKEDISTNIFLTIRIERCKNMENLDTCEHFHDQKMEQFCTIVDSDSPLWGPLFSAYEPSFKCPIKKGIYRAVNSTIDAAAFLLFPMDNWYWRVITELHDRDTNNVLMCVKAEAHITIKQ